MNTAFRADAAFKRIQQQFPIREQMIYLNNGSIGAMSTRVIGAVNDFLGDVRDHGRTHYPDWCRFAEHEIKTDIGRLIGADRSEIAFVKNTTEGLCNVANGIDWREGDNVIVADIEYPSNVYCWMNLKRRGVEIKWVPTRDGRILIDDIAATIDRRTRVVSFSGVQFSNGFRLDLERLCELCQRRGVLLNLDMIHWLGALRLDLSQWPIDFLSAGGHKWLLGPIGTGIFFCRKQAMEQLRLTNVGYHTVDKSEDHLDYDLTPRPNAARFEEALVNFPGIYGLHASVRTFLELGMDNVERHILGLTDLAIEGLRGKGYRIVSSTDTAERSGNVCFSHPSLPPETIELRLKEAGIQGAVRPGGIRISPTIYNDEQDIDAMLDALPESNSHAAVGR